MEKFLLSYVGNKFVLKNFFTLVLLLILTTPVSVWTQNDIPMIKTLKIGDSTFKIIQQYGAVDDKILFLNVHEDEITSIDATDVYAQEHPVHFIRIAHQKSRRLNFHYKSKSYSVDPNRIYTAKGRRKTLRDGKSFSWGASKQVKAFADEFLKYLKDRKVIIAMHNNTDLNYSIKSYLPEGDEAENTAEVYVTDRMDPDDFIYTTDKAFYDQIKAKDINVILQDNKRFVNDGSLSVYCGLNGIRYLNIEAQKGHFDEQLQLIKEVMSIL
jgi:hypothetical protein